jgi:hypothetical protein
MEAKFWKFVYISKPHTSSIQATKIEKPKNGNLFKEKCLKPFFENFELMDESYDLVDPVYQNLPNTLTKFASVVVVFGL